MVEVFVLEAWVKALLQQQTSYFSLIDTNGSLRNIHGPCLSPTLRRQDNAFHLGSKQMLDSDENKIDNSENMHTLFLCLSPTHTLQKH